jgi:hypothetical protein
MGSEYDNNRGYATSINQSGQWGIICLVERITSDKHLYPTHEIDQTNMYQAEHIPHGMPMKQNTFRMV